jgi:predicted alpha/beta-fold hydrolase
MKKDFISITCKASRQGLRLLQKAGLISSSFVQKWEKDDYKGSLDSLLSNIAYESPMLWGWNCHMQNIYSSVLRSNPIIKYRREVIPDPQYVEPICLDWAYDSLEQGKSWNNPTLILLPGVTGSTTASYVNHFVSYCKDRFRIVVYTRPGCDPNTLLTHHQFRLNSHIKTIDAIINHVDKVCNHQSPLVVASFSMGGQNISRYLADYSNNVNKNLVGCLAICNPFNTTRIVDNLAKNYPLIDRVITDNIKQIVWRNEKIFKEFERNWLDNISNADKPKFSLEALKKVTSLRDLDNRLTKYIHNLDNIEEQYYIPTSVNENDLECIKRPIVYLHARDDPVVPIDSVPRRSDNANVIFLSTKHGSHCSFALMKNRAFPFLAKQESIMEVLGLKVLLSFIEN